LEKLEKNIVLHRFNDNRTGAAPCFFSAMPATRCRFSLKNCGSILILLVIKLKEFNISSSFAESG
jgi:hypothetical protein